MRQGDLLFPFSFHHSNGLTQSPTDKSRMRTGQIKCFQIGNEGLSINHLQFADDTILFFDLTDASSTKNMIETVETFEGFSGQNINLQKTKIMGIEIIEEFASIYGCNKGE